MNDSRETTMLIQGILMWLMLAFGCAAIWFCSLAIIYFLQNNETESPFRFGGAVTAATLIVAAFVSSMKLFRARHG